MLKIAAIVALLLVLAPAAASADDGLTANTATWTGAEWVYPGERPVSNETIRGAVVAAVDHWVPRGVQPCAPIRVYAAPDLDGAEGRAQASACKVWIQEDVMNAPLRARGDAWVRQLWLEYLGMVVTHEVGHLAGLPDGTPGGGGDPIMDGTADDTWDVKVYAREEIKRLHAAEGRARASRRSSARQARHQRPRTPRSWADDA